MTLRIATISSNTRKYPINVLLGKLTAVAMREAPTLHGDTDMRVREAIPHGIAKQIWEKLSYTCLIPISFQIAVQPDSLRCSITIQNGTRVANHVGPPRHAC